MPRSKYLSRPYQQKDLITRNISVKYEALALAIQILLTRLMFLKKIGQTLRSKSHGKICWTCH